jgi:hypothetical protein
MSGYDMNLDNQLVDFVSNTISVSLEANISKETKEGIFNLYNLSILNEWKPSFTTETIYTLKIPENKTALEIVRDLLPINSIKRVSPQTFSYLVEGVKEMNITDTSEEVKNLTEKSETKQTLEEKLAKEKAPAISENKPTSIKIWLWLSSLLILVLIIITIVLIQKYKK